MQASFAALPHLDLLHPVRRLFGKRWNDCRLLSVEEQLLGFRRVDDLPGSEAPAAWFDYMQPAIIRGYGADDWIRYDTGSVVPGAELAEASRRILSDDTVAYVHIRSKFNCFQCRVDRA